MKKALLSLAVSATLFSGEQAYAADLSAWNTALGDLGRGPAAVMSLSGITFGFSAPSSLINSTYFGAPLMMAPAAVPVATAAVSGAVMSLGSAVQYYAITAGTLTLGGFEQVVSAAPAAPATIDPSGPPRDDNPSVITPPKPPTVQPVVSKP